MNKYSVSLATLDDLPELYRMALDHYRASEYDFPVDEGYGKRFLTAALLKADHVLLVLKAVAGETCGCLVGIAGPHPFLPIDVATELLWWVDPEHRGYQSLELLNVFEYWAKEIKHCEFVSCSDVVNHPIDKLYERKGYTMKERSFMKRIN